MELEKQEKTKKMSVNTNVRNTMYYKNDYQIYHILDNYKKKKKKTCDIK